MIDNLSDAPSGQSYMSSALQSGNSGAPDSGGGLAAGNDDYSGTPDHAYSTGSDEFSRDPATHSTGEYSGARGNAPPKRRISESTAKYIKWPIQEVIEC